jgi:hypothetical protein
MQLYTVRNENELVMIAPLKTIGEYLSLHKAAEARIKAETVDGGICRLHINRGRFEGKVFDVATLN